MLKPIELCKGSPTRKVTIKKSGNLREARINNVFVLFQDSNKKRLLEEVDHYIKNMLEVDDAEIDIETEQKRKRRNYPNK